MMEVVYLGISVVVTLLCFGLFKRYRFWRAVATPLASIIGSGFLVVAPLLYFTTGSYAFIAMGSIVMVAYMIGSAIRFNIRYANEENTTIIQRLEKLSNLVLAFAYVISVAFYLRLLSAFILEKTPYNIPLLEKLITTTLLISIGIIGYLRGLSQLEYLEIASVSIKLGIILTLITGLFLYAMHHPNFAMVKKPFHWDTLRILGGSLLVVQGFETSKYLKSAYGIEERIRSMRIAQMITAGLYVVFVLIITPILYHFDIHEVSETLIIAIAAYVSKTFPYLLIVGAVMSQFSAAIADTIGAGGLLNVETRGKFSTNLGYLITTLLGVVLIWSANIFEIIAYASRAFALYYLLQTLIAFFIAKRRKMVIRAIGYFVLNVLLLLIVLLSKSLAV